MMAAARQHEVVSAGMLARCRLVPGSIRMLAGGALTLAGLSACNVYDSTSPGPPGSDASFYRDSDDDAMTGDGSLPADDGAGGAAGGGADASDVGSGGAVGQDAGT